jgi:adenine phosphoribosyltransferase
MDFRNYVRTHPDFPTTGTTFYDIAPLLADGTAWHNALDMLSEKILVFKPDVLVGIESRGFLLAAPLAYRLGLRLCDGAQGRQTARHHQITQL